METIIVTTDFSASATNALNYACAFAVQYHFRILLTHIYSVPATYAGEALSLATVNDLLEADKDMLRNELEKAHALYPSATIHAELVMGNFLETLHDLRKEHDPLMIIMGASADYSDLSFWDDDWLNALISASCPILVIPPHITYSPIRNIAFACDYKKLCLPRQVQIIKNILRISGAAFHVVHVTDKPVGLGIQEQTADFRELFTDVTAQYHFVEDKFVVKGLAAFVQQYDIDLLLVIPHRHGLWHSLFNKSYTKQLAQFNDIPVMAIQERE